MVHFPTAKKFSQRFFKKLITVCGSTPEVLSWRDFPIIQAHAMDKLVVLCKPVSDTQRHTLDLQEDNNLVVYREDITVSFIHLIITQIY